MIREEFKQNKIFSYPEEYDVYDQDAEKARKFANFIKTKP